MRKYEFVNAKELIPNIQVNLRYATRDNFMGVCVYGFRDAYLRRGTTEKLAEVQAMVEREGYSLCIWDAFRPVKTQFQLWEAYPDARFVADPTKGFSNHSRGSAVDLTLSKDGIPIVMPTVFDAFSKRASRAYEGISLTARKNAQFLEEAMKREGFQPYFYEWWHFEDEEEYPVEHNFTPPPIV